MICGLAGFMLRLCAYAFEFPLFIGKHDKAVAVFVELLLGKVFQIHKSLVGLHLHADQFVDFDLQRFGVAVLGVLN